MKHPRRRRRRRAVQREKNRRKSNGVVVCQFTRTEKIRSTIRTRTRTGSITLNGSPMSGVYYTSVASVAASVASCLT